MALTSSKKPIKRKIKRKKPGTGPSKVYFTDDTQKAIEEWQDSEDVIKRHIIYQSRIHNAFDALVDNLINVYGYKVTFESKDDLKRECLYFLYGVLPKYDRVKASKAFSYFNVVAKHWLIIRSKTSAKKTSIMVSLDNPETWSDSDYDLIKEMNFSDTFGELFTPKMTKEQVQYIVNSVKGMLRSETHKSVLDAVLIILDNEDELDFINKRAISLYLRNITGLSQKEISTALSTIKKKYRAFKNIEESSIH